MLNDITFGQFIDTNSFIHRADPRTKLITLILFIVFIFVAKGFLALGILALLIIIAMLISKIPVVMYLKNI